MAPRAATEPQVRLSYSSSLLLVGGSGGGGGGGAGGGGGGGGGGSGGGGGQGSILTPSEGSSLYYDDVAAPLEATAARVAMVAMVARPSAQAARAGLEAAGWPSPRPDASRSMLRCSTPAAPQELPGSRRLPRRQPAVREPLAPQDRRFPRSTKPQTPTRV